MKTIHAIAALSLATAVPASAEPLTIDQVVALSGAGIGDEAIVAKVKGSGTRFDLTTDQMLMLKGKGVSGAVIAAMLAPAPAAAVAMVNDSPDPAVPHATGSTC